MIGWFGFGLLLLQLPPLASLRPETELRPAEIEAVAADTATADRGVVVVVCPEQLQPALQTWMKYREGQGYRFRLMSPTTEGQSLRQALHQIASEQRPAAVLLIGRPDGTPLQCPILYVPAEVNVHFQSTEEIPTDNPLVDFDDDGCPDSVVARIPVSDSATLQRILERSISYEKADGSWRRRISLIAGVGGFDPTLDRVIEGAATDIIQKMLPPSHDVSMTWGSWSSPYCPSPQRFSETAIQRFNEGCLFWVYIGHGHVDRLDRIKTPAGAFRILDNQSAGKLVADSGSPIALMLCCFSGAIDADAKCLAQTMLELPQGPIAVIASTRVTMPYGMSRLSIEMMEELFEGKVETLGELLHLSKQRILEPGDPNETDDCRKMIETMARSFSPMPDKLDVELREHVAMMMVLGDPLLRLKRPEAVVLTPGPAVGGKDLIVRGQSPVGGELIVEVCYRRGRFWNRPTLRKEVDLQEQNSEKLQLDYERCRDLVCCRHSIRINAGPFETRLPLPQRAAGEAIVRAYVEGLSSHALGSVAIEIVRQSDEPGEGQSPE